MLRWSHSLQEFPPHNTTTTISHLPKLPSQIFSLTLTLTLIPRALNPNARKLLSFHALTTICSQLPSILRNPNLEGDESPQSKHGIIPAGLTLEFEGFEGFREWPEVCNCSP